ncbi:hypothetical protein [Pseudoclavibacter sp. VKM Ac-2888]|uniref:hypothetical protein n=1 Tax=Pseudoclavibacter sp. VKM Ac-2888 TaxID=2783830 RepID=UPI00188AB2CD|nr:hypothetical protein [Pseudoclavibacter sp. VKM Ac-2888]MBF4549424.1 hypothetical protein [Pseudoclavibacter sp. VKM Ac-2888]
MLNHTPTRTEFVGRHRYDVNASDTAIRIRTERQERVGRGEPERVTDESVVVVRGSALAKLTVELARVRPIRRRRYWLGVLVGLACLLAGAFIVADVFAFIAEGLWGHPISAAARVLGFVAGIGVGAAVGFTFAGEHLTLPVPKLDGIDLPWDEIYLVWRDLTPESRDQLFALEEQPVEVLRAGIDLIARRFRDARRADRERQELEVRERAQNLLDGTRCGNDGDTAF